MADPAAATPLPPVATAARRVLVPLHVLGLVAHAVGILVTALEADFGFEVALLSTRATQTAPAGLCLSVDDHGASLLVRPAWLAVAWFGCSLAFHALVLGCHVWGDGALGWYWEGLAVGIGAWRWTEYFFSSAIMLASLTILLGTRQLHTVVASTVSMGVTQLFGLATEIVAAPMATTVDLDGPEAWRVGGYVLTRVWRPGTAWKRFGFHVAGYVPYALAWYLAIDAWLSVEPALVDTTAVPSDAGHAVWAGVALFTLFGLVQLTLLALPFGPAVFWCGEAAYVCLSFVAKATMAFLLVFRGLTPERTAAIEAVAVSVATTCGA